MKRSNLDMTMHCFFRQMESKSGNFIYHVTAYLVVLGQITCCWWQLLRFCFYHKSCRATMPFRRVIFQKDDFQQTVGMTLIYQYVACSSLTCWYIPYHPVDKTDSCNRCKVMHFPCVVVSTPRLVMKEQYNKELKSVVCNDQVCTHIFLWRW